ncbi:S46 family peptidase [Sphingomonas bacterium]|uniref:S46 family peptidase n=1 Tax=Sphingomonas bacterium TaxID=1895847 RepID=UPI0020C70E95|nr:S46 family peptidase [Sphingomonas bacterium]
MTGMFGRMRIVLAASVCLAGTPALGEEGMWTFDNFPSAKVKALYGVDITPAWLDHVRGAAVRLSTGCSASTVSGRGLVLTNNHCVAECAQDLSSKGQDYYTRGYLAEEKTCPGMQAEILTAITDVTDQVTGAGKGLSGDALVKARTAVTSTIEQQACTDQATTRCQVVSLYHGGQYKLYAYRKYSDVRLVFSPGVQMAFFGGDPDNFNFPRYDLDSAFVRLYENGRPVASPGHLVWNAANPVAGQPVFVAGNPASTERQLTVAQLETQRDLTTPMRLTSLAELRGRLIRFGEENEENRRVAQDLLFGLENSYKVYVGEEQALVDPAFMAGKRAEEAALKAKVATLKSRPAGFGDPWADLAAVQAQQAELALPLNYVERGPLGSTLFDYARRLVRAAAERQKPSAQRLPGYADAQLPLLQKQVFDPKPVEPKLEQLVLEFWLSKARENMTADSPETKLLLGRDSPEDLSAALAKSSLGDPAVRRKLWDGGAAAIAASRDPMIQLVLRIDPEARRLRAIANEQVTGPATVAAEKIAKARFAAYGTSTYPDATFTLRLSYGTIQGWTYRGQTVPPFTYFPGLYERATGKPPFDLDQRWVAAQGKLSAATVFDMSTSNDIIGGNSGSPLINAKGEVIGAVFDGNIHSLGGDYGFDPKLNRAVAVSAGAVSEALRKVYHADALAEELAKEG